MDTNTKMIFLDGYRRALVREKALREEVVTIRERQTSAKAIGYDSMPHGTDIHDLSDYIVSLEEKTQKLLGQMRRTDDALQLWVSVVAPQITDKRVYALLYNRHIKGQKPTQAAVQAGYCTMQESRYPYSCAVRDLQITEHDIDRMNKILFFE